MMADPFLQMLSFLLPGLWITIQIGLLSIAIGFALSIIVGAIRTAPYASVRMLATAYVELFRGTSLLVQIFYFFFVLPLFGLSLGPFWAGVWALSINTSAYGSEIVRGAILSVDRRQHDAAIAIGLSPSRTFWRVILPQAALWMILPLSSLSVLVLKSTPLLSLISVGDLLSTGQIYISITGGTTLTYLSLLIIYYLISLPLVKLAENIHRRLSIWRF